MMTDAMQGYIERINEKRIGRAVLSVSAWTSPLEAFEYQTVGGRLRFHATDIGTTGNLVLRYAKRDADPSAALTESETLELSGDRVEVRSKFVDIYPATDTRWSDEIRFSEPVPSITVARGMAAAADVPADVPAELPAELGEAVAVIVRA